MCSGVGIKWAIVKKASLIERIAVLGLPCLHNDLYDAAINDDYTKDFFAFLKHRAKTRAPGNDTRIYDGFSVLLRVPVSKNRRSKLNKALNQTNESQDDTDFKNPYNYVLSDRELTLNNYPRASNIDNGYIMLPHIKSNPEDVVLLAIDCEMALTENGPELTRVSIVDSNLNVIYDKLVKPKSTVIDYLTQFSGITEEMLCDVNNTVEDIQQEIVKLIPSNSILLGHSLENDLHALMIIHNKVIDTALLYPHARGGMHKYSLKYLAEHFLKLRIQEGEHDSIVDAQTAMKLVLRVFEKGNPNVLIGGIEENITDLLNYYKKNTAIVDSAETCKIYSSPATDCFPVEDIESCVEKSIKASDSRKYHFIFSRLNHLERYYKGRENDLWKIPEQYEQEEISLVKDMIKEVKAFRDSLPKNTLFIVTGCHGNIHRISKCAHIRKKRISEDTWTEQEETEFVKSVAFERNSTSFFEII